MKKPKWIHTNGTPEYPIGICIGKGKGVHYLRLSDWLEIQQQLAAAMSGFIMTNEKPINAGGKP